MNSQVIDLKPGVDFFPSRRERRHLSYKKVLDKPRRARGVGKRMPVEINLTAIIKAVPNPLVRDLLTVAAKEFMRVRG